jgi:hypothetical protein
MSKLLGGVISELVLIFLNPDFAINPFGKSKHWSTLVMSRISCIASGLALLEDEKKFKLGGCVSAHKTLISCTSMSSKCMK